MTKYEYIQKSTPFVISDTRNC